MISVSLAIGKPLNTPIRSSNEVVLVHDVLAQSEVLHNDKVKSK